VIVQLPSVIRNMITRITSIATDRDRGTSYACTRWM